jgi:hypothetical protein
VIRDPVAEFGALIEEVKFAMDSNFRFRAGRNRYPIGSAELSWGSSRGLNPKSEPRISSASALISALRGSYGVFVTPSPSATACADATLLEADSRA